MRFHPNYPNDNNKGQRHLWNELKNTFQKDEGVAYYRYPIFTKSGSKHKEPDFLMIHRDYGIWVFECKGCHIGHIADIEGHEWVMREGWYSETMAPVSQVDAQMFEVKTLVERDRTLAKLQLPFEYRVILPFVTASEWSAEGYTHHPCTEGVVWVEEDIEPARFRQHVKNASSQYMPRLTDGDWERLLGVFRGVVSDEDPRSVEAGSSAASPSRVIHAVESRLKVLDDKQDRVAQEVPDGPQRIRGLAGTGKTVLFTRRAAQMHAANSDWDIAFVFWSRSLRPQVQEQIEQTYRRMTGDAPYFGKLRIWHAWGARNQTGFYREVTNTWGLRFRNFGQAESECRDSEQPFEAVMRLLDEESQGSESFLDALIVDEGQDLPAAFYRVAYRALRDPKRLYWAYDEAQGIDSLVVPSAVEVFGRDANGNPNVDLSGAYESGISKAHNMHRCYRTPRLILTAAHAINMGLLRSQGPLQGVTTKTDWEALGYRVLEGDFSPASVKAGREVVIERDEKSCGHPADVGEIDVSVDPADTLQLYTAEDRQQDVDMVVQGIERDLEAGLRPDDIVVICLEPFYPLRDINDGLRQKGIRTFQLTKENADAFRRTDHVTLTGIRRAKGNEAYKVYVLNLHAADEPDVIRNPEAELVIRNQIFTALTRAKQWCVGIGRPGGIMTELQTVKANGGRLSFRAFNQTMLKRSMVDADLGQIELI